MKSEQINELAAALSKAQGEMKPAVFDKVNPHFKSPYASLTSCWEAVRPALSKHGLSLTQLPVQRESGLTLVTTLMHTSGQWMQGEMPITGATPQQQGSCLSYIRRYSLSACLGIVSDDDDDAEATKDPSKAKPDLRSVPAAPKAASAPAPKAAPKPVAATKSEYRIPFGKLKGKAIAEVPPKDLLGYCDYLREQADMKGEAVSGIALEFLNQVDGFIQREAGGG